MLSRRDLLRGLLLGAGAVATGTTSYFLPPPGGWSRRDSGLLEKNPVLGEYVGEYVRFDFVDPEVVKVWKRFMNLAVSIHLSGMGMLNA